MRRPGRARSGDRGGATVVALACAGVLVLVGAALGVVAVMLVAHRTAQSAADLSALAGASDLGRGGDGCARAGQVAVANGADLTGCAVRGLEITVEVLVVGPRWLGQQGDLPARARAGPAGATAVSGGRPDGPGRAARLTP